MIHVRTSKRCEIHSQRPSKRIIKRNSNLKKKIRERRIRLRAEMNLNIEKKSEIVRFNRHKEVFLKKEKLMKPQ